jgi:hypothetical protein
MATNSDAKKPRHSIFELISSVEDVDVDSESYDAELYLGILDPLCAFEASVCPHRPTPVSPFIEQILRRNKRERSSPIFRDDRLHAHTKIQAWDEKLFRRVFRVSKRLFKQILDRMIDVFPSNRMSKPGSSGMDNYEDSQRKGGNATPWGPIILEVKLYIFLRILAGASYIDMIWFGVQLDYVQFTFKWMLKLFKVAFPAKTVLNFDHEADNFVSHIIPELARGWNSAVSEDMVGTILCQVACQEELS